ncbi:MAG TPA: L,D-transpeptidase family protein [Longimicrobiales bacterium]
MSSSLMLLCAYDRASAQLLVDESNYDFVGSPAAAPFIREQLRFTRVREARSNAERSIKRLYRERGIRYPAAEVYVRVFKTERTMEVWVRGQDRDRFELLKAYRICAMAGGVGPKKRRGDQQVPEGFYNISTFNPTSSYHLSLRIDYPNQRDEAANSRGLDLGGDIYIHGGCRSEGCLAITDDGIDELYWIALTARGMGQRQIPVHIFPARFGPSWDSRPRKGLVSRDLNVMSFWKSLKPGYYYFERHHRVPQMIVDARGRYRLSEQLANR